MNGNNLAEKRPQLRIVECPVQRHVEAQKSHPLSEYVYDVDYSKRLVGKDAIKEHIEEHGLIVTALRVYNQRFYR